ncbi:hypothetical protein Tco_0019344 [Tanacetum coccineum]
MRPHYHHVRGLEALALSHTDVSDSISMLLDSVIVPLMLKILPVGNHLRQVLATLRRIGNPIIQWIAPRLWFSGLSSAFYSCRRHKVVYLRILKRISLKHSWGTWDAELDMADSFNYITEERFDQLGFVRLDYGKYRRKMVREVHVEIHGFTFLVDFVVIGYANEDEPSVSFGRDFLVTSKSRVDFGIGKMRINLTMLEEMKEIDAMLDALVENLEEVGSSNNNLVKMGKASRNKNHKVNKLTPPPRIKIKEISTISTTAPPSPISHLLTQKQKEKMKEVLDHKYKKLEESKPILEALENYMTYRKKLDEVLMGRARLNSDDYGEEVKMRIVEHGLPKKMRDVGNFVLPVKVNGTIEMNALADTGQV